MFDAFRTALLPLAALLSLVACTENDGKCTVTDPVGTMTVLNDSGSPLVAITLNGKPAVIKVDSGADVSMFSERAAKQYDLAYGEGYARVGGISGATMASMVVIDHLGLGNGQVDHAEFPTASYDFGTFRGLPIVGLFGGDFLYNYETVFDLPNKQINLYHLSGCGERHTPTWTDPTSEVPFDIEGRAHIELPIMVNDHKIWAFLDSGSRFTTILPEQAEKAGVTKEMLARDPQARSFGIDNTAVAAQLHHFDTISIGSEKYVAPWLMVSPIQMDNALLGADFLRHNRVWASYRDRKLYIQRADPPGHDTTFHPRIRHVIRLAAPLASIPSLSTPPPAAH